MSAFAEDDARLAAMHGYDALLQACEEEDAQRIEAAKQILSYAIGRLDGLETKLDALETLVREIRHALAAGAVGRWT